MNAYIPEALRILNDKGIIFTTNPSPQVKKKIYSDHVSRLAALGAYHIGDYVVCDMRLGERKSNPLMHGVFSAFTKASNFALKDSVMKDLVYYGKERSCFHPDYKLGPVGDQQRDPEFFGTIIKAVTEEDELVVDLYMGSGSCGVACLKLKRKYIGYEIREEIFNWTVNRINCAVDILKELEKE